MIVGISNATNIQQREVDYGRNCEERQTRGKQSLVELEVGNDK